MTNDYKNRENWGRRWNTDCADGKEMEIFLILSPDSAYNAYRANGWGEMVAGW